MARKKDHQLYRTWVHMRNRCRNPKTPAYRYYGARGISVCERWMSFENFVADMGERPSGHTLDRIDNNGNYEPSNCRWATQVQQLTNRRPRVVISVRGEPLSLKEINDRYGIQSWTIARWKSRGLDLESNILTYRPFARVG